MHLPQFFTELERATEPATEGVPSVSTEGEYNKGFLFSVISLVLSVITFFVLAWGKLASIGVQMGLFVLLTILNIYRKPWAK